TCARAGSRPAGRTRESVHPAEIQSRHAVVGHEDVGEAVAVHVAPRPPGAAGAVTAPRRRDAPRGSGLEAAGRSAKQTGVDAVRARIHEDVVEAVAVHVAGTLYLP